MKKKIIPLIFGILGVMVFFVLTSNDKNIAPTTPEETVTQVPLRDGKYCYQYSQKATQEAPYSVEEYTEIVLKGNTVLGLRMGSQSGPGMSNGYDGSLEGTREGNTLKLRFKYVIEGSSGEEMELYSLDEKTLTKHRYTLKEEGGILVPNMDEFVKDMVATKVSCRE